MFLVFLFSLFYEPVWTKEFKKNAGIPENMGVLGETGSSSIAMRRGILDWLVGIDCGLTDIVSVRGVRIDGDAFPTGQAI